LLLLLLLLPPPPPLLDVTAIDFVPSLAGFSIYTPSAFMQTSLQ